MSDNDSSDEMGYVYIMTNPSFRGWEPDLIKIGYAKDVEKRVRDLNSGVPYSFRIYATYKVPKVNADKLLHHIIDILGPDRRVKEVLEDDKEHQREFFQMSADEAYTILRDIAKMHGREDMLEKHKELSGYRDEDRKIIEQIERQRAAVFSFEKCNIKPGETITFEGDPSIKLKVVNDRQVEFDGEVYYLSPLASKLSKLPYGVRGSDYFMYKGVQLTKLMTENS